MADPKDVLVTPGKKGDMTVVAEDKNWRSYVAKGTPMHRKVAP